ncbi:hypothetical protein K435DRAFT_800782 [Dendrothele bispora CBS 962.96]|uniref:Uncharacterized protein n=1 Tax=Dendrothele bispora (strain CBS 962.96) TaxID=1314807 RepID=A0A4S8LST6_DENBC|nr:hypothetical protein K435DRAFT_800782 [Dendrothele bispora CBS 962.96]
MLSYKPSSKYSESPPTYSPTSSKPSSTSPKLSPTSKPSSTWPKVPPTSEPSSTSPELPPTFTSTSPELSPTSTSTSPELSPTSTSTSPELSPTLQAGKVVRTAVVCGGRGSVPGLEIFLGVKGRKEGIGGTVPSADLRPRSEGYEVITCIAVGYREGTYRGGLLAAELEGAPAVLLSTVLPHPRGTQENATSPHPLTPVALMVEKGRGGVRGRVRRRVRGKGKREGEREGKGEEEGKGKEEEE